MKVLDLSHWLSVDRLALAEVTLLIVGADPSNQESLDAAVHARARTVEKSILQALDHASDVAEEYLADETAEKDPQLPDMFEGYSGEDLLITLELRNRVSRALQSPQLSRLPKPPNNLCSASVNGHDFQRWMKPKGLYSAFQFRDDQMLDLCPNRPTVNEGLSAQVTGRSSSNAGPWPWGRHETKHLRELAAAAERWWINFDPNDNTTAPTNDQVSEWLQARGVVGKTLADKMATILRADGLPTGPRT